MDIEQKKLLVKVLLTLQSNHNGCKEETMNIVKEALGIDIEHNVIREMINVIPQEQIDLYIKTNQIA